MSLTANRDHFTVFDRMLDEQLELRAGQAVDVVTVTVHSAQSVKPRPSRRQACPAQKRTPIAASCGHGCRPHP
ncbi:MAG: hypothetical protein ACK44L_06330, partial [Burkholderiales bacterium]